MQILANPIKHCKICFGEIKDYSLYNFMCKTNNICEGCFAKFRPRFIHFQIGTIHGLSIYEYDAEIKDLLFKFKGCYDIELADVFFPRYLWYLKLKYREYHIVPVPSYYLDDQKRGFNHVVEIFSRFKLPMLKILIKSQNHKQAKQGRRKRISSQKNFEIVDIEKVRNKKILIVDDVYTTGSSIRAAINLVKQGKPKKIEVLVVAKNVMKEK